MKRLMLAVLALFAALTFTAAADDTANNCGDGLSWSLVGGTLTISGSGEMYSYSYKQTPWYESRGDITKVIIEDGTVSISPYAFYGCENLKSAAISKSVKTIGISAFASCGNVETVYVDDIASWLGITFANADSNPMNSGAQLYCGGSPVWEVKVPDGTTAIGNFAFTGCESIRYVIMPGSIQSIGKDAFSGCVSLKAVTIPSGVKKIEYQAFKNCTALTSITLPASIMDDGESGGFGTSALVGCENLRHIYFSGTQTQWSKVNKPAKSLPDENLYTVHCGCSLFSWSLSEAGVLTVYGTGNMGTNLASDAMPWYAERTGIKTVVIRNGVTMVAANAFANCTELSNVVLAKSVSIIGQDAFYNCIALRQVAYQGDDFDASVTCVGGKGVLSGADIVRAYPLGDVDKNNAVDINDARALLEQIIKRTLEKTMYTVADANGDKKADIGDVQRLYRHANGKEKIADTLVAAG